MIFTTAAGRRYRLQNFMLSIPGVSVRGDIYVAATDSVQEAERLAESVDAFIDAFMMSDLFRLNGVTLEDIVETAVAEVRKS